MSSLITSSNVHGLSPSCLDNIQYCPLVLRRFETVEIAIRGDTGVKIPFERGRVVVTLHFTSTCSTLTCHPRFDQGAIHVQRIYSPGYVCHVRYFIISGWKIQHVESQERLYKIQLRKRRRNDDSRLRPHTVLPSGTKTLSDR
jgi:hypothetical protein